MLDDGLVERVDVGGLDVLAAIFLEGGEAVADAGRRECAHAERAPMLT